MGQQRQDQQQTTTAIEKATDEIGSVLERCNTAAIAKLPALAQAVTLATGISQLRSVMTDDLVRKVFMPLQGSALGFKTDRDNASDGQPREYPIATVRECMIEAMIAGFQPVGNEINIIAGRTYAAKNGYERKLREFPGLTDLHMTPGVPQMVGDKGALISYRAVWKLNGSPMQLIRDVVKDPVDGITRDTRFVIRVNKMMGADAIIGKATRKMRKAIYDMLSGSEHTLDDGDLDAIDTIGVVTEAAPPPTPSNGGRMKMGRKRQDEAGPSQVQNAEPSQPAQEQIPTREMGDDGDQD